MGSRHVQLPASLPTHWPPLDFKLPLLLLLLPFSHLPTHRVPVQCCCCDLRGQLAGGCGIGRHLGGTPVVGIDGGGGVEWGSSSDVVSESGGAWIEVDGLTVGVLMVADVQLWLKTPTTTCCVLSTPFLTHFPALSSLLSLTLWLGHSTETRKSVPARAHKPPPLSHSAQCVLSRRQ